MDPSYLSVRYDFGPACSQGGANHGVLMRLRKPEVGELEIDFTFPTLERGPAGKSYSFRNRRGGSLRLSNAAALQLAASINKMLDPALNAGNESIVIEFPPSVFQFGA